MDPVFPSFVQVLGRMHPLVLHLPIGLFVGLAVVELLALFGWLSLSRRVIGVWAWLAALSALASAGSGWVLGHESGYGGESFERHETLGLIVGALALVVAGLHTLTKDGTRAGALRAYRVALFVAAGLLVPTGHLGAGLTHGEDFLFAPLREKPQPPTDTAAAGPVASTFDTTIQPILAARCTACHGESKHKGKLALHTRDAIEQGGDSGPALDRVQPKESELLRRITLPLEDDEHMPPSEKPQLSGDELAALEAWILAGAPFEGSVASVAHPADSGLASGSGSATESTSSELGAGKSSQSASPIEPEPKRPSRAALDALAAAFVHVERVAPDSELLWIDFSGIASQTDDAKVVELVTPVAEFVGELTLARSGVGAGSLELAAGLSELARLDLRGTSIDDAALAKLSAHPTLRELVLAQTKLSDVAVETLVSLPKLERVFLWKSGVPADALLKLREARPQLVVDAGDTADSVGAETETEIKLSSDAPLPGAPAPSDGHAALVPINTKCPVSGAPVNPKYAVVYDGKVIGFCCPNCPKEFWSNPEACLAKLE